MKKDTHPDYQEVLFVDSSNGHQFVCGTTLKPKETATFEGKEYPVMRLPVTSASHPFFTGSNKLVDTEGRVKKFMNKYEKAKTRVKTVAKQQEQQEEDAKTGKQKSKKKK